VTRLDGWPEPNYRDPDKFERDTERAGERLRRGIARLASRLERARKREEQDDERPS
jgi:hypothetical protein